MADLGSYLIVKSEGFGAVDLDMQHSAIHSSIMAQSTIVDDTPPVEVLIPEARQHQQRRYRRSAVIVSLVALLVGALIAVLITTTLSGSGTSRRTTPPSAAGLSRSMVLIRPVLCFAPPYTATAPGPTGSLPQCPAPYELTASALHVTPSPTGFSSNNIAPYPALAGYPNSTGDSPNRAVLVGGFNITPRERYLLGPSEMRLSAANVGSVVTQKNRIRQWVVNIHLTSAGAAAWDRVANENFHQLLAVEMGGKVVSAPLIQPTQSHFTSFRGVIEISGALNASTARSVSSAVKG